MYEIGVIAIILNIYSATWPHGVQQMADQYLTNPIKCNVGSLDLTAVHSVRQIIEVHLHREIAYQCIVIS